MVDGIILKSAGLDQTYDDVTFPLMMIEQSHDVQGRQIVEVDDELGGALAVRHLLDCGYRHIAFILGKEDTFASAKRLRGARRALGELGVSVSEDHIVMGSFSIEGGREAARQLFETNQRIDAVFAVNDLIGMGVLQYCNEARIRVPQKVGIIGFDNIVYTGFPQIELTTVHQPKRELGRLLFETLYAEIHAKKKEHPVTKISLNPELKIRKTTRAVEA